MTRRKLRPQLRHPLVLALESERIRQGLTQTELAHRAPLVHRDHVSAVESGRTVSPGLVKLTHIAAGLGKDICLVDEEDYW